MPYALLLLAPYVATDAGLAWNFDGEVRKEAGRYGWIGKEFRGDLTWFVAKQGGFDAEKLYESDVRRTKDAPESKGFTEKRTAVSFAGMPAIQSNQRYAWNGVPVACRCVYAATEGRAWVVRLWWPPASAGAKGAGLLLGSVKRLKP